MGIIEVKGKTDMQEEAEQEAGEEADEAKMNKEKHQKFKKGGAKTKFIKRREFVLSAKNRQRRRGATPSKDSKYTGRKRRPKF